jgi:hypothetical protein
MQNIMVEKRQRKAPREYSEYLQLCAIETCFSESQNLKNIPVLHDSSLQQIQTLECLRTEF